MPFTRCDIAQQTGTRVHGAGVAIADRPTADVPDDVKVKHNGFWKSVT